MNLADFDTVGTSAVWSAFDSVATLVFFSLRANNTREKGRNGAWRFQRFSLLSFLSFGHFIIHYEIAATKIGLNLWFSVAVEKKEKKGRKAIQGFLDVDVKLTFDNKMFTSEF